MFRVQDNVPEVYINESRDFQILARLSDVLFSGMKYDIDSMVNILDATLARDTMLELMCTKIGFFPRVHIDANVLKYIIASFPYIIKYKGTLKGIQYAVNAILKAENNPDAIGVPKVIPVAAASNDEGSAQFPYTIYIYTTVQLYNKLALKEVLRYVLPAGYNYQLLSYYDPNDGSAYTSLFEQQDELRVLRTPAIKSSALRTSSDVISLDTEMFTGGEQFETFASKTVNAFDTTQIITSDMYFASNENGMPNNDIITVVEGIVEVLPTYRVIFVQDGSIKHEQEVTKYNSLDITKIPSALQPLEWYSAGVEHTEENRFNLNNKITSNLTLVNTVSVESSGGDE